jgi:hypothetical protein
MSRGPRTIYLVQCVSQKLSRPAAAKDLYCSPWFAKARAFVEAQHAPWFILSGKYGAVAPDTLLQPYNITLNDMGAKERRDWAARTAEALRSHCAPGDRVVFLAGSTYREYLAEHVRSWGCRVEAPLARLGIGKQLRWLGRSAR